MPVNAADGHYLLDAAALREAGVRLPGNPAGQVAVDALPEVRADYDSASQQLHLQCRRTGCRSSASTIPDWSPAPGAQQPRRAVQLRPVLLGPADGATPWLSALLEQRLFDGFG